MSREYIISVPDDAGFVEYSYIRGGRKYNTHYAYKSMGRLVRCGECRYCKKKRGTFKGEPIIFYRCTENERDVESDDYCCWGEREDE